MDKKVLNIKEVQEFLGIGRCSTLDLFHNVSFPSFKLANKWFVKYEDLMNYLDTLKDGEAV